VIDVLILSDNVYWMA